MHIVELSGMKHRTFINLDDVVDIQLFGSNLHVLFRGGRHASYDFTNERHANAALNALNLPGCNANRTPECTGPCDGRDPSRDIVIVHGDDWMGVYVNGKRVAENHSIYGDEMLAALGIEFEYRTADSEWLDEHGRLPDELSDVKFESQQVDF